MDSHDHSTPSLKDGALGSGATGKLAGRYRLESQIARGTMTDLWRAEDEVLGRTVAAKILRKELLEDPIVKRRFRMAATATARLSHAHIVSIFDTGEHEGAPFMVMEHLAGGTLRDQLADGPLDPKGVALLGAEVAAALNHAHSSGIFHHDIRPENILFTETGHLKVSDFGLAPAVWASGSTRPQDTPSGGWYLSPELAAQGQADARADLYSLGVVLYECVTGFGPRPPAPSPSGESIGSVLPPPHKLRPDVSPELEGVIMKALARAPEDRYPSAHAMERALRKAGGFGGSAAKSAGPPPLRTRRAGAGPRQAQPSGQSFLRTEGRWLLPTMLVILAAVGLVLAIPSLRNRVANVVTNPLDQDPPAAVRVVNARAYDPPPGDGAENDGELRLAFDGNPQTSWSTSSYDTPPLGGLKEGVGVLLDLGDARQLESIRVQSVAGGWQGVVRSSDDGRNFTDVGRPLTASTDQVFRVSGTHRYWMLWITRLTITSGKGNSEHPYVVAIREITPSADA